MVIFDEGGVLKTLQEVSDAWLAAKYEEVSREGGDPDFICALEEEIRYRWLYEQGVR